MALAAVLAPGTSYAQSLSGSQKGAYGGGSVGVYLEASEGHTGAALAGSGIIGYRFGSRWAIQGEIGGMGNVYCYEANLQWSDKPTTRETICHRDYIVNIDMVRRFTAGSLRPYVALGLGVGVHASIGVEFPIGKRIAVVPAVDVNLFTDMLAVRPKVALLARF